MLTKETKDTQVVVGVMVAESNKAKVVVADGSKCWGVIFSPTLRAFVRFEDKKSYGCSES
jgi:hypothetical protein